MPDLPSGTVTFLFTDIEGSTRLWETVPEAMEIALARHDEILRSAVAANDGYVFSTGGDGFGVAFRTAGNALAAAAAAQTRMSLESWPDGAEIRVRMGMHTGEVQERGGDYFGPAVNRAARLMAIAHGGQVVCSQATAALVDPATELRNLGAHRLRDLASAEVVFQVGDGSFPPLRSVDLVPTNLPTLRTELIGRADDLTTLGDVVQRKPLVTLVGVGGVGKTRLALGLAAVLAPRFVDGCWLVELAPIADGAEVLHAVAAALGAPVSDLDALVAYLADRRTLIVLDNCEHVVADAAEVVDAVLADAPEVRVLATSREPLGVEGEQVHRVESLTVPPADADVAEASGFAAVRLFTERASAVNQQFSLDPENVAAVTAICRHLDGIPLALELAAGRAAAMAPADIAARLDERFRLLSGGSRRAQERHRTLLATVAWSHDLLDADEKIVFRRLSVFPATFDLRAAEAVAAANEGLDVLDAVTHLVTRSLVQYEPEGGRYRLLETLRQYGADRLTDATETAETRDRHARYFLELVEDTAPMLTDARYVTAHAKLSPELDNLRALVDWCVDGDRWPTLAETAANLWMFLMQAAAIDGAAWFRQLMEHADDIGPQSLADSVAYLAYLTVINIADYEEGRELGERSIGIAESHGALLSSWALLAVTLSSFFTSAGPGLESCEQALDVAEARGDDYAAVIALGQLAAWCNLTGVSERGAACAAEALRRAEAGNNSPSIQVATTLGANSFLYAGSDPDFASSLALLETHDDGHRFDTTNSMWLDILWGTTLVGLHRADAVAHLTRAIDLADRHGAPNAMDLALNLLAIIAAESGYRREAATLAGYGDAHLRTHRFESPVYWWVIERRDDALAEIPDDRARAGRATRHEIKELVRSLASMLDPGDGLGR